MKNLTKITAMLMAAALAATMATGCGSDKKKPSDTDQTNSQAAEVSIDEGLAEIVEDASHTGVGTAGQMLKWAGLARDVAALAAERGYTQEDMEELKNTFEKSVDGMDDDALESVEAAFTDGIFPILDKAIADNKDKTLKPIFEDAGVAEDMANILKAEGLADSYNTLKSAYFDTFKTN